MAPETQRSPRPASRRQLRSQLKRLLWLNEAQAALSWGIVLVLAALVGAIYLNQTSHIAATGRRIQILQEELSGLKRQNAFLEREIAESQSLERLQLRAAQIGFIRAQPDDIEYLVVEDFPAGDRPPPQPTPPPLPEPIETMNEAMWLAIKASFTGLVQGESSDP